MALALYLDTSVVLRATLEAGTTPEMEARIASSRILMTSRLSLVESARALIRARQLRRASEKDLADVQSGLDALWSRCEIWELTESVCELACHVAPGRALRTLDALHLATFVTARRRIEGLELLTVDDQLRDAAQSI
ncbi:MAG: type II toxin-antitoxin system VapC family toxin [Vicinamibacteria bacterium]